MARVRVARVGLSRTGVDVCLEAELVSSASAGAERMTVHNKHKSRVMTGFFLFGFAMRVFILSDLILKVKHKSENQTYLIQFNNWQFDLGITNTTSRSITVQLQGDVGGCN